MAKESIFKFENGVTVKCILTGFKGTVTSRVEYLTGCIQYGVTPAMGKDDKKIPSVEYLDESQLKQVGVKKVVLKPKKRQGPRSDCPNK